MTGGGTWGWGAEELWRLNVAKQSEISSEVWSVNFSFFLFNVLSAKEVDLSMWVGELFRFLLTG